MPNPTGATIVYRPTAASRLSGVSCAIGAKGRVSKVANWLFYLMLAFNTLNLGALYTKTQTELGDRLAINPITFAVLAIPIFLLTKKRPGRVLYFRVAWLFWLTFTIGGFFGPDQITMYHPYGVAQKVIKIWISIVGVPWLAWRVIDASSLVKFARATYVFIAAGAVCSVVQLLYPEVLAMITEGGRGAGLWIDPNLGASICSCGLLLSLMYPFRLLLVNIALRGVLLCGLGATLSRGGILACLIALVIYGMLLRKWTAVLKTACAVALVTVLGLLALEPLKQSNIEGLAHRAEGIQQMLMGGIRGQTAQGRWNLWRQGFTYASQSWLFGRGHGSMDYIVKLAFLENEGRWLTAGPHNYYILVWGNSGLLALLAFCGFLGSILLSGWRCQHPRLRAGMISLVVLFSLMAMSDHSLFAFQFYGAVFGVVALTGYYGRKQVSTPRRVPRVAPM